MVKKVVFITSNQGIEHDELTEPLNFLKSKGFEVIHAAEKNEDVATVKGDTKAATQYTRGTRFDHVDLKDCDLLAIPGGTGNADTLRINEDAHELVQHLADNHKPVAAICQGPWPLIDA